MELPEHEKPVDPTPQDLDLDLELHAEPTSASMDDLEATAEVPSDDLGEAVDAVPLEAEAAETTFEPFVDGEEARNHLSGALETLLFISDRPMSLPKLRSIINPKAPLQLYRELMTRLKQEFALSHRGVEIVELSHGFQLRTKPHLAPILRRHVRAVPLKLTSAMMEALAVVAYRQPVTKEDVDQVRSVDSSYLMRTLMEKRLIRISGRSDLPGRPMLYETTHEFLELFNLKDLSGLPALHEIESMVAASEVGAEQKEVERLEAFGQMVDSSLGTQLFQDGELDVELEEIKRTIETIRTSTPFLDEQKARENLDKKLARLAEEGLTLNRHGETVPLGSVPAEEAYETLKAKFHEPSTELQQAAQEAREERLEEALNPEEPPNHESAVFEPGSEALALEQELMGSGVTGDALVRSEQEMALAEHEIPQIEMPQEPLTESEDLVPPIEIPS